VTARPVGCTFSAWTNEPQPGNGEWIALSPLEAVIAMDIPTGRGTRRRSDSSDTAADNHDGGRQIRPLTRHDECRLAGSRWSCWPSSAEEASSPVAGERDRDLEIFRITADHFRHVLNQIATHSSYFLIIQSALFSIFATVIGAQADEGTGLVSRRREALFLAVVGLVFASFWAAVSRQRIKALDLWRKNLIHMDGVVDRHGVYLEVEQAASRRRWTAPSTITAQLPWLIMVIWLCAIIWLLSSG
jgi:hypothetical protein